MSEHDTKPRMITWDREMLKRFKEAYAKAQKAGEESFKFDGVEYVIGYAHYLIEYLNSQFGIHPFLQ